jgi:hypothetical protein
LSWESLVGGAVGIDATFEAFFGAVRVVEEANCAYGHVDVFAGGGRGKRVPVASWPSLVPNWPAVVPDAKASSS